MEKIEELLEKSLIKLVDEKDRVYLREEINEFYNYFMEKINLDMSDVEIAELLNVNRSTVYRHRISGLAMIKEFMKECKE